MLGEPITNIGLQSVNTAWRQVFCNIAFAHQTPTIVNIR